MDNPVRATTLFVVKNAKDVKINKKKIKEVAELLVKEKMNFSFPKEMHLQTNDQQKMLDYLIILDSLNFCFWSKKQRWQIRYGGKTYNGYYALSLALKKFFEDHPDKSSLDYLSDISFKEFKEILQGGKNLLFLKKRWQIVRLTAKTIIKRYKTSKNFVKSANNKFSTLVHSIYKKLPCFNDIFSYGGHKVYLLKRAQILACDIWGAFDGKGISGFKDLDYLTCFPDYKIPQILNHFAILEYSKPLKRKIEKRMLIPMGSSQEIEIRSATVIAVELLKKQFKKMGHNLPSFKIDWILWNKSKNEEMKTNYHLTKTIFY